MNTKSGEPSEKVPARSAKESVLWFTTALFAIAALTVAIVALVYPNDKGTTATASAAAATGGSRRVTVDLGDLFIRPNRIEVAAGTKLTLVVRNGGALSHDLKLTNGTGTSLLKPGGAEVLEVGTVSASLDGWCTVAGHKDAGMKMSIVVPGSAAATATPAASATGAAATSMPMANGAMPAAAAATAAEPADAVIDFTATPGTTWKRFDPTLAPAPGGTEHTLTMHASETVLEVSPGVTQEMWTFNGQAPGPILRGKVGDLFTVTLVNDGKVGHSIDFHASRVAWNDKMRTIQPGESLVYQFKAEYAGIFMYHCGTAPALHHIGNGMYGAVIIDPPDLAPVDHEFVLVQSELYIGPMGKPGDLKKMTAEAFDAVVFNGYVSQYKFAPIRVEPDQRVRVWVLDAGPSENSAFHIVGTIFDTVFKEGTYVLRPDGRRGGSQVLDLQPAQGGFVEFSFAEKGLYPIVTHKFANVGKGALGLFQAGDVVVDPATAKH